MEFALGVLLGIISGVFLAAAMANASDKDTEASGVWTIKDRAYRLTRINADA